MTLAELHAALNDFPPVLIVASVVFDLWAAGVKREEMRWAAYWCLCGGAASAILALASGLLAERRLEQTPALDRLVETHETLGIAVTVVFAGLAGWRIWRRNHLNEAERQSYTMVSLVGALGVLWLAHLGGTMVYRHAAGIPGDVLQREIRERADSASGAGEP